MDEQELKNHLELSIGAARSDNSRFSATGMFQYSMACGEAVLKDSEVSETIMLNIMRSLGFEFMRRPSELHANDVCLLKASLIGFAHGLRQKSETFGDYAQEFTFRENYAQTPSFYGVLDEPDELRKLREFANYVHMCCKLRDPATSKGIIIRACSQVVEGHSIVYVTGI